MSVSELRMRFQQPSINNHTTSRKITPHLPKTKTLTSLFSANTATPSPRKKKQHIEPQLRLTVKQLCFVFEQLASQYGLHSNAAKTSWLAALQKRLNTTNSTINQEVTLDKDTIADIAFDAGLISKQELQPTPTKEELKHKETIQETIPEPESRIAVAPQSNDTFQMISTILPSTPKKTNHNCDMIVCAVVTKTVNGHRVHEIGLKCQGCSSQFVLTAAHECEVEEGPDVQGLEWLSDGGRKECINMIL
jgi:hypothetical protein